jgi:hypothetical protein
MIGGTVLIALDDDPFPFLPGLADGTECPPGTFAIAGTCETHTQITPEFSFIVLDLLWACENGN